MENIEQTHCDLVFGYSSQIDGWNTIKAEREPSFIGKEPFKINCWRNYPSGFLSKTYYGKLFRKSLIIDHCIEFLPYSISQDYTFASKYMLNAQGICYLDLPIYYHRVDGNARTSLLFNKDFEFYKNQILQRASLLQMCIEANMADLLPFICRGTFIDSFIVLLTYHELTDDELFQILSLASNLFADGIKYNLKPVSTEFNEIFANLLNKEILVATSWLNLYIIMSQKVSELNLRLNRTEVQFRDLQNWCAELQEGKDWLEEQYQQLSKETNISIFEKIKQLIK